MNKNTTIFRNTIYLYVRMLVVIAINLYSSRLVLQYLGVDDFGIYNIVGGIVSMMLFVNNSMSGATSRYINYSLGQNNPQLVRNTLSTAILFHSYIAAGVLLLGETVGLWFVNTQLNIPEGSMVAANWVYQFSLLSSVITTIQVPLNACVISYERMGVFAAIEIFNAVLKCAVIVMLVLFSNRLITYSILLFVLALVIFSLYLGYCRFRIPEFTVYRKPEKSIGKPMLAYMVYDLYGNGTFLVKQQGTNVLINRYFSVALNAASGVATQASGLLSTFISNVYRAFTPQIMKEYSANNVARMSSLMRTECELLFMMLAVVFIPLFINLDFVMQLWLGVVPAYAVDFCRLLLVVNVVQMVVGIAGTGVDSTGTIGRKSIWLGSLNVLCVVLTFVFFRLGFDAQYAYVSMLVTNSFHLPVVCILLKKQIPSYPILDFLKSIIKGAAVFVIAFIAAFLLVKDTANPWIKSALSLVYGAVIVAAAGIVVFPKYRKNVINKIKTGGVNPFAN